MKTFYALIKGTGEGCDYTIGCNQTWFKFNAPSFEEAEKKVEDEYFYSDQFGSYPSKINLIEVDYEEELNVAHMVHKLEEAKRLYREEETKKKELEELKRLQEKYKDQ
jgi:hypothetical protein